jgi:hypothetical protein
MIKATNTMTWPYENLDAVLGGLNISFSVTDKFLAVRLERPHYNMRPAKPLPPTVSARQLVVLTIEIDPYILNQFKNCHFLAFSWSRGSASTRIPLQPYMTAPAQFFIFRPFISDCVEKRPEETQNFRDGLRGKGINADD